MRWSLYNAPVVGPSFTSQGKSSSKLCTVRGGVPGMLWHVGEPRAQILIDRMQAAGLESR